MYVFTLSVLFSLLIIDPAYAYLDLGTGTIIVQAIVGGIAAVVVWLKFNWARVKNAYMRFTGKSDDDSR